MERMPDAAEFGIYIHFDKNSPSPQRIFQAADEMISAFVEFDRMLVHSLDSGIEPVLMLEDIEAGSLLVWLRNALSSADDQAIKEFDWKQQVGSFLVKGKYLAIDFLNKKIEADDKKRIERLRSDLIKLAADTDIQKLPGYAPVPAPELVRVLADMSQARSRLSSGDMMKYVTRDSDIDVSDDNPWSDDIVEELSVKERLPISPTKMLLLVKRPDYIGNDQWEFKHGKSSFLAKIADLEWLSAFQQRRIDVRPGDALRCIVSGEVRYSYDNEVINQRFSVDKVEEVIEQRSRQIELLPFQNDGEDKPN